MKTKPYNDNSRKPENWTDKKLQAECKREQGRGTGMGPSTARMRMLGAEVMRRRRVAFSK